MCFFVVSIITFRKSGNIEIFNTIPISYDRKTNPVDRYLGGAKSKQFEFNTLEITTTGSLMR